MQTESTTPAVDPTSAHRGLATSEVLVQVYDELRALAASYMRRERPGHTLPPTAVVHEVYLRLAKQDKAAWSNRAQFLSVASRMIRRILVDHARVRCATKRGGGPRASRDQVELADLPRCEEIACMDEALDELAALDERQARVVELRYYGGLDVEETAQVLGVSPGTVKGDWRLARAWLAARLK